MKNTVTIVLAGVVVLLVSLGLLYGLLLFVPSLMEEYYNPVFRSNSFETDWLFYLHPFALSAALYWFWQRTTSAEGTVMARAFRTAVAYTLVAMVPVLLLTFSAIDVSAVMVITWVTYGLAQAWVACLVFAGRDK